MVGSNWPDAQKISGYGAALGEAALSYRSSTLGYSLALRKWAVVSEWEVDVKGKLETSQCGVEDDLKDGEGEMQWLFSDPNALYLKVICQLLM